MKRLWILAVVLMCGVFATQALAFEISPAILDVAVNPGSGEQKFIHLVNDEKQTVTYLVTVQKFIPSGENGQQEFLPPSDTSGLPDWTFVDAPNVTLKPGEAINFPVSFRIPANASAGTYTEAVFFSLAPQPGQGNVATTPRIGALVFLTVNGTVVEKQVLDSFSSDKDSYHKLPVSFTLRVRNDGNTVEVPTGTITIRNLFGQVSHTIPVNAEGSRVLPGSTRYLNAAWDQAWGFGPYTATLAMDKTNPPEASLRIFVWPLKGMAIAFGGLLLLIAGYFGLKRLIIYRATR